MKPSIVLVVFALFLISAIPTYCKGSVVEVLTTHKESFDLTCQDAGTNTVTWKFGDQTVTAKDKVYEIFDNNTLRIVKIEPKTVGTYVCEYKGANGTVEMAFVIQVRPYVDQFDKVRNVIQGDPLRLDCKAYGVPPPTITWFRDGIPLLQDGSKKITLKQFEYGGNDGFPAVDNGTIRIVDLDYEDQGNYSCFVTSTIRAEEYIVNATVRVQVKDKYAALWPFLGICVEVAVLCTIILIYERRRAKRIEEEERQEEAAHLNANNETRPVAGGEEVRQRK